MTEETGRAACESLTTLLARIALALANGQDVVLLLAVTALGAAAALLDPAYTET